MLSLVLRTTFVGLSDLRVPEISENIRKIKSITWLLTRNGTVHMIVINFNLIRHITGSQCHCLSR